MDDNGIDALVAAPRRLRGVKGGVAGGQADEGQVHGVPRRAGSGNLVDRIVGLQRRQAGTSRYVFGRFSVTSVLIGGPVIGPLGLARIRTNRRRLLRPPRNKGIDFQWPTMCLSANGPQEHHTRAIPACCSTLPPLSDSDVVRGTHSSPTLVHCLLRCGTRYRHRARR